MGWSLEKQKLEIRNQKWENSRQWKTENRKLTAESQAELGKRVFGADGCRWVQIAPDETWLIWSYLELQGCADWSYLHLSAVTKREAWPGFLV